MEPWHCEYIVLFDSSCKSQGAPCTGFWNALSSADPAALGPAVLILRLHELVLSVCTLRDLYKGRARNFEPLHQLEVYIHTGTYSACLWITTGHRCISSQTPRPCMNLNSLLISMWLCFLHSWNYCWIFLLSCYLISLHFTTQTHIITLHNIAVTNLPIVGVIAFFSLLHVCTHRL